MFDEIRFNTIERLPNYVFAEVNAIKMAARRAGEDIIDFSMGNPEGRTPQHIVDKLCESAQKDKTHGYSASAGIYKLRLAICNWYKRKYGVNLDPDTEEVAVMGSKEGFDLLFKLAKELHGEVGASRAAVDAGWIDHDRQIGQTGVTVHPKVYIACGISGQIQHIAGMQDSGIIISINNDPDAPINKIADYVIRGTVEEVVPKLIKYYKQNSK